MVYTSLNVHCLNASCLVIQTCNDLTVKVGCASFESKFQHIYTSLLMSSYYFACKDGYDMTKVSLVLQWVPLIVIFLSADNNYDNKWDMTVWPL